MAAYAPVEVTFLSFHPSIRMLPFVFLEVEPSLAVMVNVTPVICDTSNSLAKLVVAVFPDDGVVCEVRLVQEDLSKAEVARPEYSRPLPSIPPPEAEKFKVSVFVPASAAILSASSTNHEFPAAEQLVFTFCV